MFGSFSLEKSLITKIIIINKGARNADAANAPIIRLEFNKGFLTNGSPQRPNQNTITASFMKLIARRAERAIISAHS